MIPAELTTPNFLSDASAPNQWGLSLDYASLSGGGNGNSATWLPIPTSSSAEAIEVMSSTTATTSSGDTAIVTFGAKANASNIHSGTYQNELIYTIISEPAPMLAWQFDVWANEDSFTIPTSNTEVDTAYFTELYSDLLKTQVICNATYDNRNFTSLGSTNDTFSPDFDCSPDYSTLLGALGNGFNYDWRIDWGDGDVEIVSGTSDISSVGITHQYPNEDTYTITISPADPDNASVGWLDAFGANGLITGLDYSSTSIFSCLNPIPRKAISPRPGALQGLFAGTTFTCAIPDNLFNGFYADFSTELSSLTEKGSFFDSMFLGTFYKVYSLPYIITAYAESIGDPGMISSIFSLDSVVIPENLFANFDTSYADSLNLTFAYTFSGFTGISLDSYLVPDDIASIEDIILESVPDPAFNFSIPSGIFASIDTSNSKTFIGTFTDTFSQFGYINSPNFTIPSSIFTSINTSNATDFSFMFANTFRSSAGPAFSIPDGLFSTLDVGNGISFFGTFMSSFSNTCDLIGVSACAMPNNLFAFANNSTTSNGTDFTAMFQGTFSIFSLRGFLVNGALISLLTDNPQLTIPTSLFSSLDTSSGTDFTAMFSQTFQTTSETYLNVFLALSLAYGDDLATTAPNLTVPADLFSNLDTSSGTSFASMFNSTFALLPVLVPDLIIPNSLFANVGTNNGTDFTAMFRGTFSYWGTAGTWLAAVPDTTKAPSSLTIPHDLFSSINTSNAEYMPLMLSSTFTLWSGRNATLSIPAGLFDSIYTSSAVDIRGLYASTFSSWQNNTITSIADSNGLFRNLDTSHLSPTSTNWLFNSTFNSFTGGTGLLSGDSCRIDTLDTTLNVDIDNLFTGADLSGITASGTDNSTLISTFYSFANICSRPGVTTAWLTGSATTSLINSKLYGLSPVGTSSYAFRGQSALSDYSSLPTSWR